MNTPYSFEHDAYAASLHERFAHLGDGDESGATVKVAGRVMLLRTQGKLARIDGGLDREMRIRRKVCPEKRDANGHRSPPST